MALYQKKKDKNEFNSANVSAKKEEKKIEDDFLFNFVGTINKKGHQDKAFKHLFTK